MTELPQRWEVLFRGRVQGVGFRFTTRDVATSFAVTGFVENLSDGRVRLVAEGESTELQRFIDAVVVAMERHIDGFDREAMPAGGEFKTFTIRR